MDALGVKRNLLGAAINRDGEVPPLLRAREGVGPDFICVGAQKGGTAWLFDQINVHPDFRMPPVKELHFFDDSFVRERAEKLREKAIAGLEDLNRQRDRANLRLLDRTDIDFLDAAIWLSERRGTLDQYAKLFNPKGGLLSGDITGSYAKLPDRRVAEVLARFPDVKILYIAREPIARLWSQYSMIVRKENWEDPTSLASVERFIETGSGLEHSSVTSVVARWKRSRSDEHFRLFFFDDLLSDAASLRARIIAFLGADPAKPSGRLPPDFNRKSTLPKIEMSPQIRDRLIDLLGDEILACARDLGGPALDWPKRYGL